MKRVRSRASGRIVRRCARYGRSPGRRRIRYRRRTHRRAASASRGAQCVRKKFVYSAFFGRPIERCAKFYGGRIGLHPRVKKTDIFCLSKKSVYSPFFRKQVWRCASFGRPSAPSFVEPSFVAPQPSRPSWTAPAGSAPASAPFAPVRSYPMHTFGPGIIPIPNEEHVIVPPAPRPYINVTEPPVVVTPAPPAAAARRARAEQTTFPGMYERSSKAKLVTRPEQILFTPKGGVLRPGGLDPMVERYLRNQMRALQPRTRIMLPGAASSWPWDRPAAAGGRKKKKYGR